MPSLRNLIVKLAQENPELRQHLVPILRNGASKDAYVEGLLEKIVSTFEDKLRSILDKNNVTLVMLHYHKLGNFSFTGSFKVDTHIDRTHLHLTTEDKILLSQVRKLAQKAAVASSEKDYVVSISNERGYISQWMYNLSYDIKRA